MKRILVYMCMLALSIQAVWAIILPNGSDVIISAIEKYDSGAIRSVTLAEDAAFTTKSGTFTFKSGSTVTFHENGNVKSGYLNDEIAEFYENGFLKTLPLVDDLTLNTKYGQLIFTGSEYRRYPVTFYPNGSLKSGYLKDNQSINTSVGVIIAKNDGDQHRDEIETPTYFHENGSIKSIDIHTFEVDTALGKLITQHLDFDENEVLSKCTLYSNHHDYESNVQILPKGIYTGFEALSDFKLTNEVTFYENGTIKSAYIHSDDWVITSAGKIKIDTTQPVTFYKNGTFKSARIQPQVFDTPLGLLSIKAIGIYPSGKIEYINPSSAVPLPDTYTMYAEIDSKGNIRSLQKLPKCLDIHFYENGAVKKTIINNNRNYIEVNVSGHTYREYEVWFYEDGSPMGAKISFYYIDDYIMFAQNGKFLGRAVIDEETGLLRRPTPEEDQEIEHIIKISNSGR